MLQFRTEVVTNDGTFVGLLGASPGASTCVTIALDTLTKCFGDKPEFKKWTPKLKEMIPMWSPDMASGDLKTVTPAAIDELCHSTADALKIRP